MFSKANITYIDHSAERTGMSFYIPDVTAGNFDAVTGNGPAGGVGQVRLATAALTLLNEVATTVQAYKEPTINPVPPTDENAQREQGLMIFYVDNVLGKKYHLTIPGIDRTLVAQTGTDVVDYVNNVLVAAWVTAFEANAVSELGNPVTVTGARMVGRSN